MRKQYEIEFNSRERAMKFVAENERNILLEKQDSERRFNRIILISTFSVLFIVILFVLFLGKNLREKKRAKLLITLQKELLEEKQKEMTDSYHYAERIQNSLMASEKYIEKNLNKLMKT